MHARWFSFIAWCLLVCVVCSSVSLLLWLLSMLLLVAAVFAACVGGVGCCLGVPVPGGVFFVGVDVVVVVFARWWLLFLGCC